jgi:hypothetical protein
VRRTSGRTCLRQQPWLKSKHYWVPYYAVFCTAPLCSNFRPDVASIGVYPRCETQPLRRHVRQPGGSVWRRQLPKAVLRRQCRIITRTDVHVHSVWVPTPTATHNALTLTDKLYLQYERLLAQTHTNSSPYCHRLVLVHRRGSALPSFAFTGAVGRSRSRKEFLGGVGVGKNVPTPTPTSV